MKDEEDISFNILLPTNHQPLSRGHQYLGGQDGADLRETKRRRLEDGRHYLGLDFPGSSRAGSDSLPLPVEVSTWLPGYVPGTPGPEYGAQHGAGMYEVRGTPEQGPDKSSQVQPFLSSPTGSISAPSHFEVSFVTGGSLPVFPPANQPSNDLRGFWNPDSEATPMFDTGLKQTTAGLVYHTPMGNRADGLPASGLFWTTHVHSPPVSAQDCRQQTDFGSCYLSTASGGHPHSPFPPSPHESSNMSCNSSPFPRTPSDVALTYGQLGYGPFLQRSHGNAASSLAIINDASGMDFSFRPVNTATPLTVATAPDLSTPPSPPSDDDTEIKYRSPSPPDFGEHWGMNTNSGAERCIDQPGSHSQAGSDEKDASLAQMLGGDHVDLSRDLPQADSILTIPNDAPKHQSSGKRRRRVPLGAEEKSRICNTRRMGACIRCHIQRTKCEPNELDPENLPCKTCLEVNKHSKKTIHNLPCTRSKLTTILLYRRGGLGYTKRFDHKKVMDIPTNFDKCYTVHMCSGLAKTPLRLEIRQFDPNSDDLLVRRYVHNGVSHEVRIPAYCLADVEKASTEFKDYIHKHALEGLSEAVKNEDTIIQKTFDMIAKHYEALPDNVTARRRLGQEDEKRNEHKLLLRDAVRLWFATRHGIGTSMLCGERPPGMEPIHESGYPDPGEVPNTPRMIVAQFDSIRHERIYKILSPQVLKAFDSVLTSKNMEVWFTAYLVAFLLLDLVSSASRDRLRWANSNSEGKARESRYGPVCLAEFVEDLHKAGTALLLHWHYFKRVDFMKRERGNAGETTLKSPKPEEWETLRATKLKWLSPEEFEFMKWTVCELSRKLNEKAIPETPEDGCWEDSLFWASRMFTSSTPGDYNWAPPEVFTREKPSRGRHVVSSF